MAVPERHDPVAMNAIGYPADPHSLPEDLLKKDLAPRHRKPASEFVFRATWGETGGLD